MKLAVIGTGSVGGTLGRRWAKLGHRVCFGVRDATGDAGVVVLATPYAANAEAIAAGELQIARLLEPYAMLWIQLMARRKMGRRFAFGLLRR
jgi:predicted dinucleotide-binding enzyme